MTNIDLPKAYLQAMREVLESPYGPYDEDAKTKAAATRAYRIWQLMSKAEQQVAVSRYQRAIVHGWPTSSKT